MSFQEKWLDELRSRFGEKLTLSPQPVGKFSIAGKCAAFILCSQADLFFAGQTKEGGNGFSLPLFDRIEAGALIPPMPANSKTEYYGRGLPDTRIAFIPWQDVERQVAAGDPFLWNALLLFAVGAKLPKMPASVGELKIMLAQWEVACDQKMQCVMRQSQELIRNNASEQQRQKKRILNSFVSLFQAQECNAVVCDPDDPVGAAAAMTARKNDIDDFIFAKGVSLEERIERSIDVNRVRITPAILEGRWYKEAFLPMLVLDQEGKNAYCVFRNRGNAAVAWCGTTGNLYVVDRMFCRRINPVGWNFVCTFPETPITPGKMIRFFLRGYQKKLLLLLILIMVSAVLEMFVPVINSMIFSEVIPNSDRTLLGQLFFLLITASFAKIFLDTFGRIVVWGINEKTERSLQLAIFDRILKLPVDFFRNFSPGEMAMRALGIQTLFTRFSTSLAFLLFQMLFVFIPIALMFYYSVPLAAVTLGVLLLLVAVIVPVSALISKLHYRIISQQGELDGLLERFFANIGKLHAAGAESHALAVWIKKFSEKQRLTVRSGRFLLISQILLSSLSWLLFCAMMASLLWIYQSGKIGDRVSISDFSGFISTVSILTGVLLCLLTNINWILQIGPYFKWISPLLTEPLEETDVVDVADDANSELQGAIELDNVSFSYDEGQPVLKNVSLKAAPGEFIAITGESGAGKSTLLRLMLRFETPSSGTVLLDGEDVNAKNMNRIRSRIGVVLQNADLMPDSILHNIIGVTSRYTEKDAWEAAEMAGCAEDIRNFPMQMQTTLTGSAVSGGQQQRILLAHAMLRRPKLLFLDEATRALDNQNQRIVIESLRKIKATKVVIAHRLSTIMDADRIYVLEHGSIVEVGTYDELMKKQGVFARMAARQLVDQEGDQAHENLS